MLSLPYGYASMLKSALNGSITFGRFVRYLMGDLFVQLKNLILDSLSGILPLALTVACAILVVTLGWRIFRNFTRG